MAATTGLGIGSDVGEGLPLDQMSRKHWLIRVLPEQQSGRKAPPTWERNRIAYDKTYEGDFALLNNDHDSSYNGRRKYMAPLLSEEGWIPRQRKTGWWAYEVPQFKVQG